MLRSTYDKAQGFRGQSGAAGNFTDHHSHKRRRANSKIFSDDEDDDDYYYDLYGRGGKGGHDKRTMPGADWQRKQSE